MNNASQKAIILLSGGLDSTTTLAFAKSEGFELFALSFDYGQKNRFELEKAKKVASHFNVSEHRIVTIDLRSFGGSSLTSDSSIEKNRGLNDIGRTIPSTYVPARNTLFLSFALAWVEIIGAPHIFIGVNVLDCSGYPDCRPKFIEAFQQLANLATKMGTEEQKRIVIHAPLIQLTKAQIIHLGLQLGVDYKMTSTCYEPLADNLACGVCDSCTLRQKGFHDLGISDPLTYQKAISFV